MSEVLEAPARPAFANFVGGDVGGERLRRDVREARALASVGAVGAFPASGEADVDRAVAGGEGRIPRLGRRCPRRSAAPCSRARGRRGRPARRADRAGHDARDGQAHPRGAPGGGADGADPPLLRGRGLPARPASAYEQAATGSVVYTTRRPLGVVALITPWNFPAAIPAWKLGTGARVREHRRHEARAGSAADRRSTWPRASRRRTPGRRPQRRHRPRLRPSARRSWPTRT